MSQARVRGSLAGLTTLVVFASILLMWQPANEQSLGQTQPKPKAKPRVPDKAVTMTPVLVQLRISLGLKDKKGTKWDGDIKLSQGKVHSIELLQGNAKGKINQGVNWMVRSVRKMKGKQMTRPVIRVMLEAPPQTFVTVKTAQGEFVFSLAKLLPGGRRRYLKGNAMVERLTGATRLARPSTEDDYPALAQDAKGNIWLAYNEYTPGPQFVKERVLRGEFDLLVPEGNGDQVRLRHFDGKVWQTSIAVTDRQKVVWRPTVAVDGSRKVVVAWAERQGENWDTYYRVYTPGYLSAGKAHWSGVKRLSKDPGSDYHIVSTTDAKGVVWLAWQAWRQDHFQIMLQAVADNHPFSKAKVVSTSKTNNWSPALTADSKGNVYLAWDVYDGDSYNLKLATINNGNIQRGDIAKSARFEARASIACDSKDRLWVAYEEGDEQWGKDYATKQVLKIDNVPRNPGRGLYLKRSLKVKCLTNGAWMQPAGDLEQAFGKITPRGKSLPRLAVDPLGGVWLWFRHHPQLTGRGEVWVSFAMRNYGKGWTQPKRIANSQNLMDNRPALLPHQDGVLAVYSGDDRRNARTHKQNDLFALLMRPLGKKPVQHNLAKADPPPKRELETVHAKEAEHVSRIRAKRINYGNKKLQLYRGEFHRHTEFTSHNDNDGLLEDSWRYALDPGNMDWMGNGDHDNGFGHEYPWWQIQKTTDLFHNPPVFVAAHTHERSNKFPNGHRNVIMPKRGIRPLPRGDLKGTAEKGTPDTKMLYAYLRRFGGMCASHTSGTGMGTDWRDNDPIVEPVVEIYQGHRHNYEHFGAPRSPNKNKQIGGYKPSGFVWNALGKGYKMGFQASSDHISTHMSYAVVLTDDISRKGLIDAFKRRHCYAATDNIIMEVRYGDKLMGDIFDTDKRPRLEIKVQGTAPISKLHVVRGNEYIYSIKPNKMDVDITFTDAKAKPGAENYYYVRVEQDDQNLAWASPMWITYRPRK